MAPPNQNWLLLERAGRRQEPDSESSSDDSYESATDPIRGISSESEIDELLVEGE